MPYLPFLNEADRDATGPVRLMLHVAAWCLLIHAVLTVGSAFAFATFLAPPLPEWLLTPSNMAVYAHGMKYGGPTTVVFGALAGILHAMGRLGTGRALAIFALSFTISLGSELAGTGTGLPFGVYGYTPLLGYKIADLVPFNIPTSWFFMLYASLAICGRILPAKDDQASKWWWAFVGGLVLTAWDVSLDPAMVKNQFWIWRVPELSGEPWIVRVIGTPFFYGMPLTNWLGWILTGIVVARVMLMIVPPSAWARRVSPSRFPLVLYAVNGVLPIAICFGQDMVWGGVFGTVAMAVPLWLAWRRDAATRAAAGWPSGGGAPGGAPVGSVALAGD